MLLCPRRRWIHSARSEFKRASSNGVGFVTPGPLLKFNERTKFILGSDWSSTAILCRSDAVHDSTGRQALVLFRLTSVHSTCVRKELDNTAFFLTSASWNNALRRIFFLLISMATAELPDMTRVEFEFRLEFWTSRWLSMLVFFFFFIRCSESANTPLLRLQIRRACSISTHRSTGSAVILKRKSVYSLQICDDYVDVL